MRWKAHHNAQLTKNPDLDILFVLYLGMDAWTQNLTVDEALASSSFLDDALQFTSPARSP